MDYYAICWFDYFNCSWIITINLQNLIFFVKNVALAFFFIAQEIRKR